MLKKAETRVVKKVCRCSRGSYRAGSNCGSEIYVELWNGNSYNLLCRRMTSGESQHKLGGINTLRKEKQLLHN